MKRFSILLLLCFIIAGCGTEESKYMTSGAWALAENYVFAVECDTYRGDNFKAGTYEFNYTGPAVLKGQVPIAFDVYKSKYLYQATKYLKEEEYLGTVGGVRRMGPYDVDLEAGDYVYIKGYAFGGDPIGLLTWELKK